MNNEKELEITESDLNISEFDAAEFLTDDEAIAEYLTAVMEENDVQLLKMALSDIAKAKGMTEISRVTGLNRESLYKTLSSSTNPKFETIVKLISALNMTISFSAKNKMNSQTA